MKNQKIIVLIFSLIALSSFGQKKELKAAEKALKSKNFVSAKENIVAAEKFERAWIETEKLDVWGATLARPAERTRRKSKTSCGLNCAAC